MNNENVTLDEVKDEEITLVWECSQCSYQNPAEAEECHCCGSNY